MNPKYFLIAIMLSTYQQSLSMMQHLVADSHFIINVQSIKKNDILMHRDHDENVNTRLSLIAQLDPCYVLICIKTGPIVKSLVCNISFEHSCRFYRNLSMINYISQNNDYLVVSEKYYDILWEKVKPR